jgi:iron complex outermembrane recepter protein
MKRRLTMKFHRTPLAQALSLIAIGAALPGFAQTAPTTEPEKKADDKTRVERVETVQVTGIRAAIQRAIEAKRDAETNVEVINAEDVGKMPDKNIADALSRVAGVNVQFGGALAMDEAERVAIRGTSPNLNLVTVNGHALSSGDWHVGDQSGSGRSIGFGLMPSQLIGRAVVYKNGQADITEGGIAGAVDIELRRPLNFSQRLTGEASLGLAHATLPKKTDPQISGLLGWQNEAKTFGVLLQAYKEDRHLRRDGQETFGFNIISLATATAQGNSALAGLRLPGSLNSALFEGVRERSGGYLGLQFKLNSAIDIGFSAFHSTLKANNYNSSAFALPNQLLTNGWRVTNPIIEGDVLIGATLARPADAVATQRVVGLQFDHNVREGAKSVSSFYDLDGSFKVNDKLSFKGRIGYTEGSGITNSQPTATFALINPNVTYRINTSRPTDYSLTDASGKPIDLSNPANYSLISNVGAGVKSEDKESYLHLDGEYKLDLGGFTAIKFGGRTAKHDRLYEVYSARWNAQDNGLNPVTPSPFVSITGGLIVPFATPPVPATRYPGNWSSGLDANFPRNLFRFDADQLRAFAAANVNWDPVLNRNLQPSYKVKETNNAVYLMGEFDYDRLTGNVGARAVTTEVSSTSYTVLANGTENGQCVPTKPCSEPNAIVGSRFATYVPQTVETKHDVVLPSLNLRYAFNRDMIGRFSISKTLGRPNYNELAGAINLNNTLLTGSSGNPLLKPITANNVDASFAWYFTQRGYVSGGVFYQDIKDYVKAGTTQVNFYNTATDRIDTYNVTSRIGIGARLKGAEAAIELPIGAGFGLSGNVTYVDAKDAVGVAMLGTSKTTYNIVGYYEDNRFSARLAWNHRSDYAIGFVGDGTNKPGNGVHKYKGYGGLALSLGYKFNDRYSITFDANNLTDPVRSTYFITENAPGYWHQSGRQYFLNFRAKL